MGKDAPPEPEATDEQKRKAAERLQSATSTDADSDHGDRKGGLLTRFLRSDVFEFGVGVVILYSCFLLAVEVDGLASNKNLIVFSNNYITMFFMLEWLLRVFVFGLQEFANFYGVVDTIIVWIPGVLVTWVLEPLYSKSATSTFLKTFRVMRMLRMLRIVGMFQHLEVFKDMWFLVRGMIECLPTLVGSMALIILYLYLFAIWSVDIVGRADFVNATDVELAAQAKFVSLDKAMVTLTRFMHGDDKQIIIDRLHDQLPYVWMFFWVFIAGAAYVLCNLVTAVVVEKALEISRGDMEKQAMTIQRQQEEEREELQEMFRELDKDGSGSVCRSEFQAAFEEPKVMNMLITTGFSKECLMDLFNTLDDDDGEGELENEGHLTLKEFEEGLREVKGLARSKSMLRVLIGVSRLQKNLPQIHKALESRHRALQNAGGDFVEDIDRFRERLSSMRADAASRLMQTKQEVETMANDLHELTDEAAHRLHQLRYLPPEGQRRSARLRAGP